MDDNILDGVSGGLRNFLQGAITRNNPYVRAPNSIFAPGHQEQQAVSDLYAAQNAPYGSIASRNDPTNYGSVASRQMPGQFGTYGAFNPSYLQQQKDDAVGAARSDAAAEHMSSLNEQRGLSAIGAQYTAQALSPLLQSFMQGSPRRPASTSYSFNEDKING